MFRGTYHEGAALWRSAEFGPPSPTLTWQQDRPMPSDPVATTDAAENQLRERGLITRHGPKDELWDLLTVFAQAEVEADLRYATGPDHEVRVLVALCGAAAARWTIDRDEIEIESVPAARAYSALVAALPEVPPVPGKPVTVRTDWLHTAAELASPGQQDAGDALRDAGMRGEEADSVVRMLGGQRSLKGQFGAAAYTSRKRKRVRGDQIVEVVDTPGGRAVRYRVDECTTIAPGEPALISRTIAQLCDETRASARDE